MRYRIALHQSEEGFSVSVPGLPGCWSQGATEPEALENIKDAHTNLIDPVAYFGTGTDYLHGIQISAGSPIR